MWGQTSQFPSSSFPRRDCGPKSTITVALVTIYRPPTGGERLLTVLPKNTNVASMEKPRSPTSYFFSQEAFSIQAVVLDIQGTTSRGCSGAISGLITKGLSAIPITLFVFFFCNSRFRHRPSYI